MSGTQCKERERQMPLTPQRATATHSPKSPALPTPARRRPISRIPSAFLAARGNPYFAKRPRAKPLRANTFTAGAVRDPRPMPIASPPALANSGVYDPSDRVFVSAEGKGVAAVSAPTRIELAKSRRRPWLTRSSLTSRPIVSAPLQRRRTRSRLLWTTKERASRDRSRDLGGARSACPVAKRRDPRAPGTAPTSEGAWRAREVACLPTGKRSPAEP